jgi:hypothetical protein
MTLKQLACAAAIAAITACGSPDARADGRNPGRVVDSALPREEAVHRFREGLTAVDSLAGGTGTRDELVAAYVRALAQSDTGAVSRLAVTRAEFAYLYYPTAVESRPPYDLEPKLMWMMLWERSNQGARRALTRFGGRPMTLVNYDCGTKSHREGRNTIFGPCVVRWTGEKGDTVSARLLGKILERDGRFKVLSYTDRFD